MMQLRRHCGYISCALPAIALLAASLGVSASASAPQQAEPAWHVLDISRQPEGLPQNSVSAILQTRDGYVWIGTREGLARFDGVRFTTFDARNPNQLLDSEVTALVEGDDSSLWIATHGGVSQFKNGHFTNYTTKEGLTSDFTASMCKDTEGAIWIGTWSGLSRFKDGHFTNYTDKDGLVDSGVPALYCDRDGSVWIAARQRGLSRYQNGRITPFALPNPKPNAQIRAIYHDRQKALWLGSNDGVFRLQDGKSTQYTTHDGLLSNLIHRIFEDADGSIWIGTSLGLIQYKDGKLSSADLPDAVAHANVTAIANDSEGDLWVGSAYDGLIRMHRGQFVTYAKEDGLVTDYVQAFLEDHSGTLWLSTYIGLVAFRNGKFISYTEKNGLPERRVISLAEDRSNRLWIDLEDAGVYRSRTPVECTGDRCPLASLAFDNVIPDVFSRVIYQDRSGAMWVGTDENKGLFRFPDENASTYTTYSAADGLPSDATGGLSIRDLAEGPEGELWIATRAGLGEYVDGKFRAYREADGLGNSFIDQLYLDKDGVLWIAGFGGLTRLKDGKFTNYTAKEGLFCEAVYHIIEDDRQNLWMSCSRGIFRIAKQQFQDLVDGKIHALSPVVYGLEHGLSSTVGVEGSQPGVFKSHDGHIWFALLEGFSFADPNKLSSNPMPPPVHIEEARVDQNVFSPGGSAVAPPGPGDIEFRFTGLSFLAPEKVRFKYKLEQYDRDWIDAGDRRTAFYGKIPPGDYTFRVIAANNDGVWNETGDRFDLHLQPHFYQTFLFRTVCVLAAILSLSWVFRFYHWRLKRRERELAIVEDALQRKTVAEARYRELFESAVYGIYRARGNSYLEVNRAMVAMLGYESKEELLALNPTTQVYADPVDWARVHDALATDSMEALEVTWKRKDGSPITVRLSGRRVPDRFGSGDIAEMIAQDVTERKLLETQLQQAQKMDAIGRLAGGVAHDFNNLLTVILGYTRLLLDREHNPDTEALRQVEKAAARAAALTSQLLSFSRHKMVQSWVLNINSIVANMKTLLERVIGEDIELTTSLVGDLGCIRGDRSQIEQVIMNLAVNARDAMPQGGRLHFATLNTVIDEDEVHGSGKMRAGKYVILEVSDTGVGMNKETLARIFEPFFTTKEVGRGTGLGLSTIYGIVQQCGGYVEVESDVGQGTTFRIYLPRTHEAEAVAAAEQRPRRLQGSETILLVEDHAALREMTSTMLQATGYTVLQAAQPSEAERICREYNGRIDLVVTDVVMPETSGPELAKQLKRLRPYVRLMYTSGYTDNAALREEVLNHNLPFLQKPYGQAELLGKVREVLDTPVPTLT